MSNDLSRLIRELTAANEAAKQGVEELEKKRSIFQYFNNDKELD